MAQVPLNYGSAPEDGTGDPLRTTFAKIQSNLTDLDTRLLSTSAIIGTLGGAAYLNVGVVPGTVADGGALAAETSRAINAEQTNATAIAAETSRAQSVEALKAPLASPAFTGIPTVPTAAAGTSTTQIASTAFVAAAVAAGGGGGSGGVPTSRQILTSGLATGGGDLTADRTITVPKAAQSDVATGTDDAKALTSFSIAAALGAKAPYTAVVRTDVAQSLTAAQRILAKQNIGAGPTGVQSTSASMTLDGSAAGKLIFTGTAGIVITLPTVAQIGSDQFVAILNTASGAITAASQGASNIFTSAYGGASLPVPPGAMLIFQNDGTNWVTSSPASTLSPAFTGAPTAPTQAAADNSTKLATTAYADRSASNAAAAAASMPPGAVSYFAMSTPPTGWLKADGSAISRATYAALFAAISTTFGTGDGSTTFNLPDMRGYFARSFDDGRGIDAGRTFGSTQADAFASHSHAAVGRTDVASGVAGTAMTNINAAASPVSTAATGGNETRPKNIALLACIKF